MSLYGALGEAVRTGKEVLSGEVALDGANPTVVSVPFASVDSVSLTLKGGTVPTASVLTYTVGAGVVNIFAWEPTDASTTTLTASDSTDTVSYDIIGRRRQ